MKDFIPLGTGNSRYLKSVQNFLSLYPTYESMVAALVAGKLPIDLNGINPEGIAQMADPLNKSTLLKDTTAALFGLGVDAVPDHVLGVLSRFHKGLGNEYVWAKSDGTFVNSPDPNAYPLDDGYTYTAFGQLGAKVRIETGTYTGTGTYGNSNMNSLTFDSVPALVMVTGYFDGTMYHDFIGADGHKWVVDPRLLADNNGGECFYTNGMSGYSYGTKSKDGRTIYWHNNRDAGAQMNASGFTYYYIAVLKGEETT